VSAATSPEGTILDDFAIGTLARRLLLTLDMPLSFTSLAAALILWNAATTPVHANTTSPSPTVTQLEGSIVAHADLNGDGSQELIVSLPDTCEDDGRCVFTVLQAQTGSGYRTLMPPTTMWDLSPSSAAPAHDWTDLVEARRQGAAMDDITIVRWRFDGRVYRRVEGSEEALPATPLWTSDAFPRSTGCAAARVG
jgi:hypothetical protein